MFSPIIDLTSIKPASAFSWRGAKASKAKPPEGNANLGPNLTPAIATSVAALATTLPNISQSL